MEWMIGILVVAGLLAVLVTLPQVLRRVTVFEYERGLKYVKGQFRETLEPGQYWYLAWGTTMRKMDVRPRWTAISGQEVLSADGVSIKVSLAVHYGFNDVAVAVNTVQDFESGLYTELQLALREVIGSMDIDTLLSGRGTLAEQLHAMTVEKAAAMGLRLIAVNAKDFMFPGALKEMFAQVVSARKEGLAALERARGEQAAIRNLVNTAELVERHPQLMQLRLLQVLGESSGNRVALDWPASPPLAVAEPTATKVSAKRSTTRTRAAASKKKPAAKKRTAR